MNLKELRQSKGLTQTQVVYGSGVDMYQLSRYEQGYTLPALEDMIALETYFDQRINWNEPFGANRHKILQDIIDLSNYYPIQSVLNFAQKSIRQDIKKSFTPGKSLEMYSKISNNISGGGSLPPIEYYDK